ncbi:hypothetical protein LP417_24380 [Polaromonas sp. P1-6]|nr:hypothetical protein LP417_24380 [Polaromonas sp. P1-6]
MNFKKTSAIGGQWLCEQFGLRLVNALGVHSQIGASSYCNGKPGYHRNVSGNDAARFHCAWPSDFSPQA